MLGFKSTVDATETEMTFDVFASGERRSAAIHYLGTICAPDEALGRIYAQKIFGRRQEHRSLWLVRRSASLTNSVDRLVVVDAAKRDKKSPERKTG